MRESDLLAHIYDRSRGLGGAVVVGPGDDTAVVRVGEGDAAANALLTVDQLVEGRHYDPDTASIDQIARKSVARALSDIAAMGGCPTAGLAAATLRAGFTQADELFDAMARWASHWNCPLAGGDIATADGPTVLSVTIIGLPHGSRGPVLRSGAKPGDSVYVTGALGGSLQSGRHLTFEPRIEEGAWLCDTLGERLHAMIDLSDGLGRDAARLATASHVRIEIDADAIPLSDGVSDWRAAVGDGEDYELCFAVAGDAPARTSAGVALHRIGRVVDGDGCEIRTPNGETTDAAELGWDHQG